MNEAFLKHAIAILDNMTDEELIEGLRAHGLILERKEHMNYPNQELRLYAFVNFYLSSIQQGIQTGHAAVDIVRKYEASDDVNNAAMVLDWADNFKTFITLNGGNHAGIKQALVLAETSGFPFVAFHEDEDSLGGLMTAVAVVLPADIFNLRRQRDTFGNLYYSYIRDGAEVIVRQNDPLFNFVDFLKSKDLAK
jgi:hypothetical protein